jgi:hypothetical protein
MRTVSFPIERTALLEQVGSVEIRTDWEKSAQMKTWIEPIGQDAFSCAADFYCALIAHM